MLNAAFICDGEDAHVRPSHIQMNWPYRLKVRSCSARSVKLFLKANSH